MCTLLDSTMCTSTECTFNMFYDLNWCAHCGIPQCAHLLNVPSICFMNWIDVHTVGSHNVHIYWTYLQFGLWIELMCTLWDPTMCTSTECTLSMFYELNWCAHCGIPQCAQLLNVPSVWFMNWTDVHNVGFHNVYIYWLYLQYGLRIELMCTLWDPTICTSTECTFSTVYELAWWWLDGPKPVTKFIDW